MNLCRIGVSFHDTSALWNCSVLQENIEDMSELQVQLSENGMPDSAFPGWDAKH